MEETFAMGREEDVNNNEGTDRIEFKQLRRLCLRDLPKMTSFCRINSNPNSFFNEKVAFPSLEHIQISFMDNLEIIWANQLCKDSFPNLKSMEVRHCKKLLTIFQSSILEIITRLESLNVNNCYSIEKIFDLQGLDFEELHPGVESQLQKLDIRFLPKLEHIWNEDPQKMFSFPKLKNVEVHYCWSLKYLFPISIAKSLPELERLWVYDCGVEKIVVDEREVNEAATFVFPQITSLTLWNLPKLKAFYDGVHTSHWPNLKTLELHGCDQVELLALELFNFQKSISIQPLFMIEKDSCFQCLRQLTIRSCMNLKVVFLSSTVAFPSLEDIKISSMDDLEIIWANQLCKDSFPNLKSMEVKYCDKLSTIFQSSILEVITRLESLTVENCVSIEKIFDLQGLDCEELQPRIEGQLRKLDIRFLPKLEHIWNEDPQKMFSFPKLKNVEVGDCWSLKYLFPISIAKRLPELEHLRVSSCGVEKIVVDEREANEAATFVFPQITFLKLSSLPKLKTFYDGVHTSHWPNLKTLALVRCDQVELFALELFNFQRSNEDMSIQPLFMIEKLVPSSLSFQNLTYLEVRRCNSLKNLVMSSTAKSLVQLREMIIRACDSMIEVVVNDQDVTEDNIIFSRLRSLKLFGLSSLICFCSGNYVFELPSLEELIVNKCPKMKYFSSGVVTTRILQNVQQDGRVYKLKVDLNTTIQGTQDSREDDSSNSKEEGEY